MRLLPRPWTVLFGLTAYAVFMEFGVPTALLYVAGAVIHDLSRFARPFFWPWEDR